MGREDTLPVAILDVDGTLVDTIHRHIGMGGDQLVSALVRQGLDETPLG